MYPTTSLILFVFLVGQTECRPEVETQAKSNGGDVPIPATCCPSQWYSYMDSCYFIQKRQKHSYTEALQNCFARGATLWTPNTLSEWDVVRFEAVPTLWTWIGIRAARHSPTGIYGAQWAMTGGLDMEALPWLNKLFPHGMTGAAPCVAYFHPLTDVGHYTNFYTCNSPHHYICERNLTETVFNPSFQQEQKLDRV